MGRLAMFGAMRYGNFRRYWIGMISSVVAQNMEFVSISWLVLTLTNAPVAIGLVGLTNSVPQICLNLVGGVVADRVNRQRLLMFVQGCAAALYLILATLVATGLVQVWHVFAFALVMGAVRAFDGPSRMALMPYLVPKDVIPSAVAMQNIVWQLPRMVGPAIAGLLIAQVGVGASLYIAGFGSRSEE